MANLDLPKCVKQVVVLGQTAGVPSSAVIYGTGTAKKGSRWLRPLEKAATRMARAQAAAANSYIDRHKRSNQEEKDGWLADMGKNVIKSVKAGRKAAKKKG